MTETPMYQGRPEPSAWTADQPTPAQQTPIQQPAANLPYRMMLLLGTATTLFGIALLAWPDVSVRLLGVLVGGWLLLAGIGRIIGAFLWWDGSGWQVLSGIVGVLFVAAGVACLRDVTKGVAVLAFLIAVAWFLAGLAELVAAA